MKKLFALVLALIFALSFAVPALAFTEVEYDDDDNPVTLAIKLIDVGDGIVNVNFTAPPSNRGYVKNEVVCAIVSMYVPKGVKITDDYNKLVFSGDNVTLWQDENFYASNVAPNNEGMLNHMSSNAKAAFRDVAVVGPLTAPFTYGDMTIDNEIVLDNENDGLTALEEGADKKAQTYHFAIFGKVIGDDAWMRATLKGVGALENAWVAHAISGKDDLLDDQGDTTVGSLFYDDAATDFSDRGNTGVFNLIPIKDDDYLIGYYNPKAEVGEKPAGLTVDTYADLKLDGDYGTDTDTAVARFNSLDPLDYFTLLDFAGVDLSGDKIVYIACFDAPAVFGAPAGAQAAFAIVTDKKYNCVGMYVYAGTWFQVKVVGSKYKDAQYIAPWGVYVQFEMLTGGPQVVMPDAMGGAPSLMARYIVEEVIWDVFGLNLNVKGQMKPEFWAANKEKSAEVQVSPWYNEVTVPAEIELEAPKTGDVVSALGFVLIALAGLAFVAVRKVRA